MEERSQKFVLFDFDGVIADSYDVAFRVARTMHPHLTEDEYEAFWDGNIYESDQQLSCTPECRPNGEREFFSIYTPLVSSIELIQGSAAFLETLASEYVLVVVSSSISTDVMQIAERCGIAHHFSDVMGKEVHRSKVEKIKIMLDRYSTVPRDCVFVTDTLGDMREARTAGVGAIGVSWGFQRAERLASGAPFRIVDEPRELPDAVSAYFSSMSPAIMNAERIPQ